MRQDDTYEFIGTWDEQYKRVGFECDFEGRPIERLIRCVECRFWPESVWNMASLDLNEINIVSTRCLHMGPDDYCSKAKRRNDDRP